MQDGLDLAITMAVSLLVLEVELAIKSFMELVGSLKTFQIYI